MENKDAFTILRLAYDEVFLHDLSDKEVENYRNISNSMVHEADCEMNRRAKKEIIQEKMEKNKKFIWHSLMGEHDLKDQELVLLAEPNGYHLVRYDKKNDVWRSLDGKQEATGGTAMMPLPDVKDAFREAWEQIKDKPYARLSELAKYED